MNRKRLGQVLIGGVFSACAVALAALIELVQKRTERANEEQAEKR